MFDNDGGINLIVWRGHDEHGGSTIEVRLTREELLSVLHREVPWFNRRPDLVMRAIESLLARLRKQIRTARAAEHWIKTVACPQ